MQELKKEWFIHRMFPNTDNKITIYWAKNPDNNINEWIYKKQVIDLSETNVDNLEDIKF